jgi:hypothetical protein
MFGGAPIDDDVRRTALSRHQRNCGGRIDRQCRSERQHQIGLDRGGRRSFQIRAAQRLPEADRGRLEDSAARASRRTSRRLELREVRLGLARGMASLAFDNQICAVKFDEQIGRGAGATMEAIDVLRHN